MSSIDMTEINELVEKEKRLLKDVEADRRDILSAYKKLDGFYHFIEHNSLRYERIYFQLYDLPYYEETYNHGREARQVPVQPHKIFKEKKDAAAFLISEIEKVEEDLQRRKLALQHQTSEQ